MVKICTPPNVILSLFPSALLFSSFPPRQTHAREERKKKTPGSIIGCKHAINDRDWLSETPPGSASKSDKYKIRLSRFC